MANLTIPNQNFTFFVLNFFNNPTNEIHQYICSTINTICNNQTSYSSTSDLYLKPVSEILRHILRSRNQPNLIQVQALLTLLETIIKWSEHSLDFERFHVLEKIVLRVSVLKENRIVESAIKLGSLLVTAGHNLRWNHVSRVFKFVAGFVSDPNPMVRNQANMGLAQVLHSFGSVHSLTPLLVPASESIASGFERHLVLAATNANDPREPRGAHEVMCYLTLFEACLKFMLSDSLKKILQLFKSLLELRNLDVTRRIADSLNTLRPHNWEDAGNEMSELLSSLATMIREVQVHHPTTNALISTLYDTCTTIAAILRRTHVILGTDTLVGENGTITGYNFLKSRIIVPGLYIACSGQVPDITYLMTNVEGEFTETPSSVSLVAEYIKRDIFPSIAEMKNTPSEHADSGFTAVIAGRAVAPALELHFIKMYPNGNIYHARNPQVAQGGSGSSHFEIRDDGDESITGDMAKVFAGLDKAAVALPTSSGGYSIVLGISKDSVWRCVMRGGRGVRRHRVVYSERLTHADDANVLGGNWIIT